LHARVVRRLLELRLDAREGALRLDEPERAPARLVGDDARDVDQEDLRAPLALERRLLERVLAAEAERVPEHDEAAARPRDERQEEGEPSHRALPARPPRASARRSRRRAISSGGRTFSSSRIWRIGTFRCIAFLKSSAARS